MTLSYSSPTTPKLGTTTVPAGAVGGCVNGWVGWVGARAGGPPTTGADGGAGAGGFTGAAAAAARGGGAAGAAAGGMSPVPAASTVPGCPSLVRYFALAAPTDQFPLNRMTPARSPSRSL